LPSSRDSWPWNRLANPLNTIFFTRILEHHFSLYNIQIIRDVQKISTVRHFPLPGQICQRVILTKLWDSFCCVEKWTCRCCSIHRNIHQVLEMCFTGIGVPECMLPGQETSHDGVTKWFPLEMIIQMSASAGSAQKLGWWNLDIQKKTPHPRDSPRKKQLGIKSSSS
jgi:hypothetical protein